MSEGIENAAALDLRAVAAMQSEAEMEQLIRDFTPFLNARATRYSARSDNDRREELFSTAMLAFYEAVKGYDAQKGHFFPFADRVVCRRMIDHIRSIYRLDGKTIPLEENDGDGFSTQSAAIIKLSIHSYNEERRQELLADEIEQFKAELAEWGITMEMLSRHSPKHKKLRETYKKIISQISQTADIIQTIHLKHYFPVKSVAEITGLPQKNIERARTFILASLIIKMGDYEYLSDYVKG